MADTAEKFVGAKYKLIAGKELYRLRKLDPETGKADEESDLFFDNVSYRVFLDQDAQEEIDGEVVPVRNPIKAVHHHAQIELIDGKMSGLYCVPNSAEPIVIPTKKIKM